MEIDSKYEINDVVYLRMDKEQIERLVTGIMIRPNCLTYHLSTQDDETIHYEIEISKDRDVVKATS